jgi:hypothetical protein
VIEGVDADVEQRAAASQIPIGEPAAVARDAVAALPDGAGRVHPAKEAGSGMGLGCLHGAGEAKVGADGEHPLARCGCGKRCLRVAVGECDRFLTEHMCARFQRRSRHRLVKDIGDSDDRNVWLLFGQQRLVVAVDMGNPCLRSDCLRSGCVDITDRDHRGVGLFLKKGNVNALADRARSDHGHTPRLGTAHGSLPFRLDVLVCRRHAARLVRTHPFDPTVNRSRKQTGRWVFNDIPDIPRRLRNTALSAMIERHKFMSQLSGEDPCLSIRLTPLFPNPRLLSARNGELILRSPVGVAAAGAAEAVADLLRAELSRSTALQFEAPRKLPRIVRQVESANDEQYCLAVDPQRATLSGSPAGLVHAFYTLRKLLPTANWRSAPCPG